MRHLTLLVTATTTLALVSCGDVDLETAGRNAAWAAFEASNPEVARGIEAGQVVVLGDGDVDDGPELPDRSRAPLAPNVGTIVPSEQPETVTVREAPLPDTANEQPVAVPEFEKSAGSTPVTGSENVMV